MAYLKRLNVRPDADALPARELARVNRVFSPFAAEVKINSDVVPWTAIVEVELAAAPTAGGMGAVVMGLFVNTTDRFHIGIYTERNESIVPNLTRAQAAYLLHTIAYHAPNPVYFTGPDDWVPLTD
jgi:hypothetical protein